MQNIVLAKVLMSHTFFVEFLVFNNAFLKKDLFNRTDIFSERLYCALSFHYSEMTCL